MDRGEVTVFANILVRASADLCNGIVADVRLRKMPVEEVGDFEESAED